MSKSNKGCEDVGINGKWLVTNDGPDQPCIEASLIDNVSIGIHVSCIVNEFLWKEFRTIRVLNILAENVLPCKEVHYGDCNGIDRGNCFHSDCDPDQDGDIVVFVGIRGVVEH